MSDVRIHPTAIIEDGVQLGRGTSVWDGVHIRRDATLGDECIVGEKTYIAYGVRIGHRCKINASVYICAAVTLEDGVMVAAHTVFTNDRFPRATTPDLKQLQSSDLADDNPQTLVKEGATIANCTVGTGVTIGRWAMVGMGSVVTKDVPDFALVLGNPARQVGIVCKCGQLIQKTTPPPNPLPEAERGSRSSTSPLVGEVAASVASGGWGVENQDPPSRSAARIDLHHKGGGEEIPCPACDLRYTHRDGRTAEVPE